jgi:hypothetical protein
MTGHAMRNDGGGSFGPHNMVLAQAAARCGARTRSGGACRGPAMANGRCRMHGGASTGPRTVAGRERARRAGWKHGGRSAEAMAERKAAAALLRRLRALIRDVVHA